VPAAVGFAGGTEATGSADDSEAVAGSAGGTEAEPGSAGDSEVSGSPGGPEAAAGWDGSPYAGPARASAAAAWRENGH